MSDEQNRPIEAWAESVNRLRAEIHKSIVGQTYLVDRLLIGMLTDGHVLLEGLPGLAKTATVRAMSQSLNCSFSRVQFTPDLLPSDIIGTMVYRAHTGEFETKLGPLFANIVLADEINRAPAKTQAAMLEAMAERQVTIGETSHRLPDPFLVLATQNPIEQEGTYKLPEAQLDRFMLKVDVGYPSAEEELEILGLIADRMGGEPPQPVWSPADLLEAKGAVRQVRLSDPVRQYIVDLVVASRRTDAEGSKLRGMVRVGASPRATINLALSCRAHALLHGRDHVRPEDVKAMARDVMGHRIIPGFEAEAEGIGAADLVEILLESTPIP
jgi:MoxR-like ATPase